MNETLSDEQSFGDDPLLSDEQLRRFVTTFEWWLSADAHPEDQSQWIRYELCRQGMMLQLMRVVALEAGRRGAVEFVGPLLEHASLVGHLRDYAVRTLATACGRSLEMLLLSGAPPPTNLTKLLESDSELQWGLVRGLQVSDERALPLLRELAEHADTAISDEAKKKLAQVEAVPFWVGLFEQDPLARVAAGERDGVVAAVSVMKEHIGRGASTEEQLDAYAQAVDTLPDDLAQEFVGRRVEGNAPLDEQRRLLTAFARRRCAPAAFWRWLDPDSRHEDRAGMRLWRSSQLGEWLRDAAPADRQRLVDAWAPRFESVQARSEPGESVHDRAARLLVDATPSELDGTPLLAPLEALVAKVSEDALLSTCVSTLLRTVCSNPDTLRRELHRVLELVVQRPSLLRDVEPGVKRLPAELRQIFVEKYRTSEHPCLRGLALELQLVDNADDGLEGPAERDAPSGDGSGRADVALVLSDGSLRQRVFSSARLLRRFRPVIEPALLAEALTPAEVAAALGAWEDAPDSAWQIYRDQQYQILEGPPEAWGRLGTVSPAGTWQAADLALLDAATEKLRSVVGMVENRLVADLAWRFSMWACDGNDAALKDRVERLLETGITAMPRAWSFLSVRYHEYCTAAGVLARDFAQEFQLSD